MDKAERAARLEEWTHLVKNHPHFAQAFLTQQTILMEAAERGVTLVEDRMCLLLRAGLVVPFHDYWVRRCMQLQRVDPPGVLGCLTKARDPSECFPPLTDWFDDPLAGGKTVPPKPPPGPLQPF
jgi:hypothetical protein